MLARLLHLGGIDVTVFESDDSPNYRSQGGTLDLHTDTGLAALKEAALWDDFIKYARYDGQYMAIVDETLRYHYVRQPDEGKNTVGERPEIDRARLRQILTESLPEGTIRWGHHLKKVDGNTLVFKTSNETGFDLIIGADGAWSKVRKAVAPGIEPVYTGVATYELTIPDAENTALETHKLVNRGSVYACSGGQKISIQQMGDGSLHMYANFVRTAADWHTPENCGYDSTNLDEVKKQLQKEYTDWDPKLLNALGNAQGRCVSRSLYILPVGTMWEHKPGFTLIGDAAHLMTPFAGEGVNVSLEDAMLLARTILDAVKNGKDVDEEIKTFESQMFVRAKKWQQLSYDLCQDWMFTPGSGKQIVPRVISRHVRDRMPPYLQPLGTAGIYAYYFLRNLLT